jgi:hypothetical protein
MVTGYRYGAKNAVVIVAATKTEAGRRAVTEQEGRAWAEANGFLYFEVRAAAQLLIHIELIAIELIVFEFTSHTICAHTANFYHNPKRLHS